MNKIVVALSMSICVGLLVFVINGCSVSIEGKLKKYARTMGKIVNEVGDIENEMIKIFANCVDKRISASAATEKFSSLQKQREEILASSLPKKIPEPMMKSHEHYVKSKDYSDKAIDTALDYFRTRNNTLPRVFFDYIEKCLDELELFAKEEIKALDTYKILDSSTLKR